VRNSTFVGNSAGYVGGGIATGAEASVVDSTFSENNAVYDGGGIANYGTLDIRRSTISGNAVGTFANPFDPRTPRGGGIFNAGVLRLHNSLVAHNTSAGLGGGVYNCL
jgi:hypothetical protein